MSLLDTHADRLDWQEDGSCVVMLLRPAQTHTAELPELTMRRPVLDDLLASEKANGDDLLKAMQAVARVTSLKLAELDEVDGGDTMLMAEVLAKMLEHDEKGSLLDRHGERLTFTDHDAALKLLKPIPTPQGECDEIVVRRPSLKEVRTNQGTTLAAAVKLLAVLTQLGPAVLGRLDALDGKILAEVVQDFLGKPRQPATGGL